MKIKAIISIFFIILLNSIFAQTETDSTEGFKNTVLGGTTRVKALGSSKFINDPSDMFVNPAYAGNYSNLIWGDLGSFSYYENSFSNQNISATVKINKKLTLGAALVNGYLTQESLISNLYEIESMYTKYSSSIDFNFRNNLVIIGSYELEGVKLGLGASYFANKKDRYYEDTEVDDHKLGIYQLGFNTGALINIFDDNKLDISASLIMCGIKSEYYQVLNEKKRIVVMVKSKGFYNYNKNVQVIPFVEYYNLFDDLLDDNRLENYKHEKTLQSGSSFSFGLGVKYQKNGLLIAGGINPLINSYTRKDISGDNDYKTSNFGINYNLAVEFYFVDWFIGRIGYKALTINNTEEYMDFLGKYKYEITNNGYDDGFTLGVGFRFGGFYLDATVDESIIKKGLGNIGGSADTFQYVTLGYNF
jgi:hypothetical protein